jgi:hypothetical protein
VSSWGGRRDGAGRPPGSISKNTVELRSLAQQYGPAVIQRLALMAGVVPNHPAAENAAVQVAAMKELLDRGYGRAQQPLVGDENSGPVHFTFEWAAASPQPETASHFAGTAVGVTADDDEDVDGGTWHSC